jgi:tetratricopeptide (TPR) repeat protein
LVYYGVAGIGKTSLRKEFTNHLEEYNLRYQHQDVTWASIQQQEVIWSSIDLQMKANREKNTFLVTIKNDLQKRFKIDFPAFESAHAIYWKKVNPEIPLRKENYLLFEGDEALDNFFEVVDKIPYFSLVPTVARLLKGLPDYLRKWWTKRGEVELQQLSDKDPMEVEEMLPYFWAQDINNYLEYTAKSAVFFIDTYEALWENYRHDDNYRDEWIREELIPRLSKNVMWVILGREELKWEEADSEWSEYLTHYKVEELVRKYCIEYLENRGITDNEIQETIFEGSKGIPFYLELSIYIYEKIVENNENPKPEDFGENHQKIRDRFFRFLTDEEKSALNVLSIPHFWDYDLFEFLVKEFNTGYPTNNYEDLCHFSFIGKVKGKKRQMHQLMQECLQKIQIKKKPDSVKRIHEAISKYYTNKLENIDIKVITPEHEIALVEAFYHAKESLEAEELFIWFTSVSNSFYKAAFWQLITPMYEEMLEILENELEPEHDDVVITLNNLAELYKSMGAYQKALSLYQRALEISENVPGSQNLVVAAILSNLAGLYGSMGAYEKALPLCLKALDIYEKMPDSKLSDVAALLNNLAQYYGNVGDYRKAIPLFHRALEINENVLSPQHPDIAKILNNLAEIYRHIGAYEKALPLYQRALEIHEKALGLQHPAVATSLNNLALLYSRTEDYEKALPLYQRALDIRERVLGPEHPDVASSLNNLAGLYRHMGNYEKVLPLCQKALEISNNLQDLKHPVVIPSLNNLSLYYGNMGDYEKALLLSQRSLEISEHILGTQHLDVADILRNLAGLYSRTGDYEKALPLYQRSLEISEKVLGLQHPDTAISLNSLAGLYYQMGDYEKALPLYQRTLEIRERILGPEHPSVADILNNLAGLYYQMEDYEKALLLFQRSLEICENEPDPQHQVVAVTLSNIAGIFSFMGDYEQALPLYQRSLEISEKVLGKQHPDVEALQNVIRTILSHGKF